MCLISVVIPLYNKAPYIKRTIDSVLNQSFTDYEIVVVDDGSTDGSTDIIENEFHTDKIRIIKKENGGPSSARNLGARKANSEWVVFLDADDLMLPFCLNYFWNIHLHHPNVEYFVGNFFMMNQNSITLATEKKREGILKNPYRLEAMRELTECTGSAMYKRQILLSNPFNEKYRRFEDAECQYRLMRGRDLYITYVPVMITDRTAYAASACRYNSEEEFGRHMVFKGKSFWEQMCLYLLAIDFKWFYPEEARNLYKEELKRLDLKIMYYLIRIKWRLKELLEKYYRKPKEYDLQFLLSNSDYTVYL